MRESGFKKLLYYFNGLLLSYKVEGIAIVAKVGRVRILKNNGKIFIGKRTRIWPDVKLSCTGQSDSTAILKIGSRSSIGDRTEIHCGKKVEIGDEVLISWDCVILDRDYHAMNDEEHFAPVIIEDGVWIGCRSIILKGVRIGKGAVIGAGSVVTKSVDANTIVAGNPAKVIKRVS